MINQFENNPRSLLELRKQLPRMSELEVLAFEPEQLETMPLNEAYAMGVDDEMDQFSAEKILGISSGSIISVRATDEGEETIITLLDEVETNDMILEPIGSHTDINNGNGKHRTTVGPLFSRKWRTDNLPSSTSPKSDSSNQSPANNTDYTGTSTVYETPDLAFTEPEKQDTELSVQELNDMFVKEESSPNNSKTSGNIIKKPSKIRQLLRKSKFWFDDGYHDIPGRSVGRLAIATDRVTYSHPIAKQHRTPRSERYKSPEKKAISKRMLGAVAVGAFAVLSVGAAFGLNISSQESSSEVNSNPIVNIGNENPSTTTQTTQLNQVNQHTYTQAEIQAFEQMASHPVEFANLVSWVEAHPGEDFDAAYQAAFGELAS